MPAVIEAPVPTGSDGSQLGDRVPDGVLTEQQDRLPISHAIRPHQSSTYVGCVFFNLGPIHPLFGNSVGVTRQAISRMLAYWRVLRLKQPLPHGEV